MSRSHRTDLIDTSAASPRKAADDRAGGFVLPVKTPMSRTQLTKWLPYVLAALAVGLVLYRYPAGEIIAQGKEGTIWPLFPIALAGVIFGWPLIGLADYLVLSAAAPGRVRWWDCMRAKAGFGLLDTFGYAVGHGAYAVWIARFTGQRPALAAGTMLFIVNGDLISVTGVASLSMLMSPGIGDPILFIFPVVCITLLALIVVAPYKPFGQPPEVFSPWLLVPRTKGLGHAGVRALHTICWSLLTWSAAAAFGLTIPAWAFVAYLPLALLIGALPINVAGFGAVQTVWVFFFGEWESGARILAFNFLWTFFGAIAVIVRGLPFVRGVVREVERATTV